MGRTLRFARPGDGAQIAAFVRGLAVYEKLERFAVATPEHFERALFGPQPTAEVLLAEVDGEPVAFGFDRDATGSAGERKGGRVLVPLGPREATHEVRMRFEP